jgi:hypothetical protein
MFLQQFGNQLIKIMLDKTEKFNIANITLLLNLHE